MPLPTLVHPRAGLGSLLRSLREGRGLSPVELAIQAGVDQKTIRNWESERFSPRLPELKQVLKALQATDAQSRQAIELLQRPRAMTHIRRGATVASSTHFGDTHVPVTLGDLLRAMRHRRGRTLEEVAARVGVVTRTLSRWERGEIAPDLRQLHETCHILGASEAEIVMLTLGAAAVGVTEPEQTDPAALDYIRAQFHATQNYPYPPEKVALLELTFLSLAIRLQPLAWQKAEARALLSRVYTSLANGYYLDGRYEKVSAFAGRALQLVEDIPMASGYAVLALVRYTNVRKDSLENMKLLERWLPRVKDFDIKIWILGCQANLLAEMGMDTEADRWSQRAVRLGEENDSEGHEGRYMMRASLLSRLKQHERAVDHLVPVTETANPDIPLTWAKVLLAKRDYEGAQRMVEMTSRRLDAVAGHWSQMAPLIRRRMGTIRKALGRRQQA